jgi:L-gulono-1,4-lactone dehydrogenase
MRVRVRGAWRNHTRNQGCDPLRICHPETLDELVDLVQEAEGAGVTVRAVGSGHSWSDAALTTGLLIEPGGLARPLELEAELLRPGVETEKLVRCEAGMTLRALNRHLDGQGRALLQMGGYDAQTIAGVLSTSTHGSGIGLGPICDFVRSLELVGSGGRVWRIEPADGPTEPGAFAARHPERRLVQDDRWFDAARVGVGCLGVIYSATLEVGDRHWLREVRTLRPWGEVREELRAREVLRRHRHYEVYISPYALGDESRCLVTTRDPTDRPGRRPRDRKRNSLPEFFASLWITPRILNLISDLWPSLTPRLLDRALVALADDEYTNLSYKVLNIGTANLLPAYSAEIGVPVDDRGTHVQAVERIRAIAGQRRELGSVYETSPISLRFVKASSAHLSMMEGRDTMMIELIQMTRTEGGFELLAAYEDALYELHGRPHWGQVNTLSGSHERVRSLYPRLDDWLGVHAELNSSGVFNSPFSKRVGISSASTTTDSPATKGP